jgi:predicted nucleic acid-binding protein
MVLALGYFMPSGDYDPELNTPENERAKQADIDDQFWRFLYLIPVFVNAIMFNLSQDKENEALLLIDKIYHKDEDR